MKERGAAPGARDDDGRAVFVGGSGLEDAACAGGASWVAGRRGLAGRRGRRARGRQGWLAGQGRRARGRQGWLAGQGATGAGAAGVARAPTLQSRAVTAGSGGTGRGAGWGQIPGFRIGRRGTSR
ncbi:MAG: hypothetical protein R3B70_23535 [Polyangiaceae bacterium]